MEAVDQVDRSDDEDMQKIHYQQMQARQSESSATNFADYFDNDVKADSRSNSRSRSPIANETVNFLADRTDEPSSIIQRAEKMDSDTDSVDVFERTLEERRIQANKEWNVQKEQNSKKTKLPKKGKNRTDQNIPNRNLYEALEMDPAKNIDDRTQMDWKSRITGAIIEDYQKGYSREPRNPESREPRERAERKGGVKFIRPRFIGLTEKFEYRNMLMSSTQLFMNHSILEEGTTASGPSVRLNTENLNEAAGFGRVPEHIANQCREMLMQYFRLFVMYESHYGGFKNSRLGLQRYR